MTREKMQRDLDTIPGAGVKTVWKDGSVAYHFYEDFSGDPGIIRAVEQIYRFMGEGQVVAATFTVNDLSAKYINPKKKQRRKSKCRAM